jgi:hypothetical protein
MKKTFLLTGLFVLFAIGSSFGQDALNKAKQAGKALDILPLGDISSTTNDIMGLLKPKLALSDAQSPKVSSLVGDFLNSKSGIVSLAKTNPGEYGSKFGGIQNKLFSGLKAVLIAAQYTKFLGLKPKTSSAGNLLSHLFF